MDYNSNNWISWWQTEKITQEIHWKKNMEIFIRATDNILNYTKDDVILDVGSGPCYLASFLKDRVKEIHCLDISERYLEFGRNKLRKEQHIYFYKLNKNDYTNLSFIKSKKFSKIICLSVIQYYNSITEVEKIIEEAKQCALPGAKLLIADIPVYNGILSNLYGLIMTGIKEKYLLEAIKVLYRAKTSDYSKVYSSKGLLTFSNEDIKRMIDKLKLDAEILSKQITVNANRKHLLIKC